MDYNACGSTKVDNNGADAVRSTTSLMMLIVELMSGYTVTLVDRRRSMVDARVDFYFPGLGTRPVPENKNVTFLCGCDIVGLGFAVSVEMVRF